MISGFININKVSGMTSNKVLSKLKGILRENNIVTKVGHFGTLDPDGEGVLPVALGRATRLFDYALEKIKVYYTEFRFGLITDTLDASGVVIKSDARIPEIGEILESIPKLVGKVAQMPPNYSAKSVDGVKAYKLARQGIAIELKTKDIEIYNIDFLKQITTTDFAFRITCSGGTYIRSIARDMAECLSTLGIMSYIKREVSGFFEISKAYTLDEVLDAGIENIIIPIDEYLSSIQRYDMLETDSKVLNGVKSLVNLSDGIYRVYLNNKLIGMGEVANSYLIIKTWLKDE